MQSVLPYFVRQQIAPFTRLLWIGFLLLGTQKNPNIFPMLGLHCVPLPPKKRYTEILVPAISEYDLIPNKVFTEGKGLGSRVFTEVIKLQWGH